MNKTLIILALASVQAMVATPSLAVVTFEGLKPLALSECVPKNTRPYAEEPSYRERSDTRPECVVKPHKPHKPVKPKPRPHHHVVPQK